MFPFRRIVFAVDFSDSCKAVVPHVEEVVRRSKAELILLHACETSAVDHAAVTKRDTERLRQFAHRWFPKLTPELVERDGDAATVICEVASGEGADLVMMPTHGRGPFRRLLLGSVTAKVLHDVGCPVWTSVHDRESRYSSHLPYQAVLCAVTMDDDAEALVRAAKSLACAYRARLEVVHVVETPPVKLGEDYGPLFRNQAEDAEAQLSQWMRDWGVDAPVRVFQGPVADRLREATVDHSIDLLITGRGKAHGRVSHLWSHLYGIVRESPCPVISL
ncbi:MAG: universal stress protein [Bryobacterales bacterium]|nr:universal stress protein [Bryobacterales bacterium]